MDSVPSLISQKQMCSVSDIMSMVIPDRNDIASVLYFSKYSPDELTCYGYSEINELLKLKYDNANIPQNITALKLGAVLNEGMLEKHYITKYSINGIKLYSEFYEIAELISIFPKLFKVNRIMMLNDIYGMGSYALLKRNCLHKNKRLSISVHSKDTIQMNIMEALNKIQRKGAEAGKFLKVNKLLKADEIFSRNLINSIKDSKKPSQLIIIQNYLNAMRDSETENNSWCSLVSKINCCLNIQAKGGSAIIKINSVFTNPTIKLLKLISFAYESMHIHKPLIIDPINNQQYVILTNFRYDCNSEEIDNLSNLLNEIIFLVQNTEDLKVISVFEKLIIDTDFKTQISKHNNSNSKLQMFCILQNLEYMKNRQKQVLVADEKNKLENLKQYTDQFMK